MNTLQTAQAIIAAGNQDAPHVSLESYKVASALIRAVELIERLTSAYGETNKPEPDTDDDGNPIVRESAMWNDTRAFLAEINKETT